MKFIPALSSENIYLSEGRKQALRNLKGVDKQRLYLGNWEFDNDPSTLMEYDSIISIFENTQILSYDNNNKLRLGQPQQIVDYLSSQWYNPVQT